MIFEATIIFLWLVYVFETYLDWRQHQKLKEKVRPKELEGVIEDEKFLKAQLYGLDKSNFGFITSAFGQVESTLILVLGGIPFLWNYSTNLLGRYGYGPEYEVSISLLMLLLAMIFEMVIGLPFGLYSTFVIEERHGFNKQTLGLYFTDKLKGIALGIVFGVPVISAVIQIIKWGGPHFYLYVWGFLFIFTIFMMTIYPNLIAPLFNKFTPLEEGELRTKIEKLAQSIDFPLTKLFVVDGSKRSGHSNAYLYGFFKNKRIVLFDTLIQQMNQQEIVAVLGHELGHWKKSHVLKMMAIGQVQVLISFFLFGQMLNSDTLYHSFGFYDSKPTLIGLVLFFQYVMSPVDHVVGFIMNALTRKIEFEADAFAKGLGYSTELKTGLIKLGVENLSNLNPDSWYSTYHYSHPPLLERLKALGKSE